MPRPSWPRPTAAAKATALYGKFGAAQLHPRALAILPSSTCVVHWYYAVAKLPHRAHNVEEL
jgi:hypothetical protein